MRPSKLAQEIDFGLSVVRDIQLLFRIVAGNRSRHAGIVTSHGTGWRVPHGFECCLWRFVCVWVGYARNLISMVVGNGK